MAINPTQQFKSGGMRGSHQSHSTRQLMPKNAGYNDDMVAEKTQSDLCNSIEQLGGALSSRTPPKRALTLQIEKEAEQQSNVDNNEQGRHYKNKRSEHAF